jgi:hypothetical protein
MRSLLPPPMVTASAASTAVRRFCEIDGIANCSLLYRNN